MVAPSIPVGWLSVAGQMAQQSPEYSGKIIEVLNPDELQSVLSD